MEEKEAKVIKGNLKAALDNLNYARCNIENCPFEHSRDEIEGIGDLEHTDGHIETAKHFIQNVLDSLRLKKEKLDELDKNW